MKFFAKRPSKRPQNKHIYIFSRDPEALASRCRASNSGEPTAAEAKGQPGRGDGPHRHGRLSWIHIAKSSKRGAQIPGSSLTRASRCPFKDFKSSQGPGPCSQAGPSKTGGTAPGPALSISYYSIVYHMMLYHIIRVVVQLIKYNIISYYYIRTFSGSPASGSPRGSLAPAP